METNVIVSSVPLSGSSPIGRVRFPGSCSPVCTVGGGGSASSAPMVCSTCVQCRPTQSQPEQHHYHEIGQTPLTNPQTCNLAMLPATPCCCCGAGGGGSSSAGGAAYYHQNTRHRHQHSLPESDSGSQQGRRRMLETKRTCRGTILTSSTENLQSGCESHCGRKKRSTLRKKTKTPLGWQSNGPEDVISLQSKSSRDVPTPSTANLNDDGSAKYSNQIEIYSEEVGNGTVKSDTGGGGSDIEVVGPPLPPRLPMRPTRITETVPPPSPGVRKYVLWCLLCGGAAGLLGIMFLGVYFLIRNYTSSVAYFETVPTFVPSTLLILTGLCIMSLARRRNRYTFLIKLSGACGLASALVCALQTVTTTAVHMSRLQGLKECDYQIKTRTCTCYTIRMDSNTDFVDDTARFVFDSIDDCGMVHGALYSCLRALFGLSVVGVLVAVISCMLVYQLLSHERKKMYWEQLELRCRSLYNGHPPHGLATIGQAGAPIVDPTRVPCRCCEQCHAHSMPTPYPWHTETAGIRFWTPGPAGNFYSPNPGGEDMRMGMTGSGIRNASSSRMANNGAPSTGWSWPRMPWQRNEAPRFRHPATPSSPDSQYGFSNNQGLMEIGQQGNLPNGGYSAPYGVWGPPPPYSDPNSPARRGRYQYVQSNPIMGPHGPCQQQQQQQPMLMAMHNDPSMGSHIVGGGQGGMGSLRQSQLNVAVLECHHQQQQQQQQQQSLPHHHMQGGGGQSSSTEGPHSLEHIYPRQPTQHVVMERRNFGKQLPQKDFYENSDCDGTAAINRGDTNSLPTRKTKKRVEAGAKSVGPNQPTPRVNVQDVFNGNGEGGMEAGGGSQLPGLTQSRTTASGIEKGGAMENGTSTVVAAAPASFHSQTKETESLLKNILEPPESEVYFGDVSSCCNVSVQQDNLYEETHNCIQRTPAKSTVQLVKEEDEEKDYLAQRFGNREASVRSRLPFPQSNGQEDLNRKMIPPMVQPRKSLLMAINKDPSRHSMCSIDSDADPKTEITDLSPNTPNLAINFNDYHSNFEQPLGGTSMADTGSSSTNFVASFPYSSTDHSQEAVRRSTTKVINENYPAQEHSRQFEVGPEHSNPNFNSYLGHHVHGMAINQHNCQGAHAQQRSPKNLKATPIKRRNIGTDISTIIQNLNGSDVSLMYQESRRDNVAYPEESGSKPAENFEFNSNSREDARL